jgi:hypothetical protein
MESAQSEGTGKTMSVWFNDRACYLIPVGTIHQVRLHGQRSRPVRNWIISKFVESHQRVWGSKDPRTLFTVEFGWSGLKEIT